MFGAIAGGIASALAGGAMSKLFGGGQKAASGGIQGDVLATDNNTVGMGDAGIKSAIQGSNVPNPDEAVPSFVSGAMAKAGKGLLEGTLQAGTSAVSDKLLDLVGLGGKSAADKGKDTRDYLAAAFPELNAWERAFLFGVIILIANILKRAFSSQLAAKLRNRLLVLSKPFFVPFGAVVYSVINIKLGEHIVALCQFIH